MHPEPGHCPRQLRLVSAQDEGKKAKPRGHPRISLSRKGARSKYSSRISQISFTSRGLVSNTKAAQTKAFLHVKAIPLHRLAGDEDTDDDEVKLHQSNHGCGLFHN